MRRDLEKNYSEYNGLHVLKAICAYLIVILHCNFPKGLGVLFEVLARIGVPCFFMINGFFSYPYNEEKIKERIFRTFKLIIMVEIVYTLATLISLPSDFAVIIRDSYFSPKAFCSLICLSGYGRFGAGWYLYALLFIYILYYLYNYFVKNRRKYYFHTNQESKYITAIVVVLLAIHIWVQYLLKANGIRGDKYTSTIWLMGIPFFIMGIVTRKKETYRKIESGSFRWLILVGGGVALLQRVLIYPSDLYAGTILSAYAAFLYYLNRPEHSAKLLIKIGKVYSKYIYLTHLLVLMILNECEKYITLSEMYLYMKPILLCVMTTFSVYIGRMIVHMFMRIGNSHD